MPDENTLEELWRRNPKDISDEQLTLLIAKLRANRALWAAGAKAVKEPKEPKVKKEKGPAKSKVSMDDLAKLI